MSWQVNYALEYFRKRSRVVSASHIRGDAISIATQGKPNAVAVISSTYLMTSAMAIQYHAEYPEMDFLCGYRKQCAWEGGAIEYMENNHVGWGSAGTLGSAIDSGDFQNAAHKDFFFSYRLIRQMRSVTNLKREFDRVFTMQLANGRTVRVGMILEYEPTADAIRTFWDRFGAIDLAWNINPNGFPTSSAIEAGRSLGCEVVKWEQLREILKVS